MRLLRRALCLAGRSHVGAMDERLLAVMLSTPFFSPPPARLHHPDPAHGHLLLPLYFDFLTAKKKSSASFISVP